MSATPPSLGGRSWHDAFVRPSRVLVVLALVLALPACTKKAPNADAEMVRARARLATLAQATAANSYYAAYTFVQQPSKATGLIRIRQLPPQYRIDVVSKTSSAIFFSLTTGTVSCSQKGKQRSCFLVARPGEEVPALFDPGVQRLFRDAVEDLAAHPDDYLVVRADPTPTATPSATPSTASATVPAGECFAVVRASGAPPASERGGFEDGTYCFAEQGVATAISVASGTLTLTTLGAPPPKSAFVPPARVVRLPDLTPTPKPTKKPTPKPTPS
ncbi:MAG: hypothetical protein QOE45_2803 [Frankiaceae bacterium]|jgi:hypothetical protein|nr:hypothetical protein [Frankiaceae bacterium]